MPDSAHLNIVFASGTAELNRALVDRTPAPLLVVAEFEPHRGEWVPYHVHRSMRENLAAVRAAIGNREIGAASMIFAKGTALAKMRWIAVRIAGSQLTFYDEQLRPVAPAAHLLSTARDAMESPRTRKWIHRLSHPAEAEIPVRARIAQARARLAGRFRAAQREQPLRGEEPLRPGVTVVIPSRDGRELLATMLPALMPQIGEGEVIVVDNGSSDGTADYLKREWPPIHVIQSSMPMSFARAVNAGIVKAHFARTLLLNNDMIVETGFVAALNAAFGPVPDLFCSTAQIFFPPGVRREETGKAVWRHESQLDFPLRCDDPLPGEDLTWVLYGSGGCSLYDTARLRALGGAPEIYDPAYVEDLDIGYRAWKRGWPSVYCAGARVEHRHRATTSRFFTPQQLDFFVERNYLRFLIHAIGSPALFEKLWLEAIRRLQLLGSIDALRDIPRIGPKPPEPTGRLSETEILALGSGGVAVFPGRGTGERKKILIASPYLPFPLSHGGAVRIFNLMRHAAAEFDLILVAFVDELTPPPPELLAMCAEIVEVRRHRSHYRRETPRPDVVEEFESEAFRACLKETIHRWRPVVAQLEFTWMAQYANACAGAKTILVEHDITFDLQEQLLATTQHTGAERWELEQQATKWRAFETAAWKTVDAVVTMSVRDAALVPSTMIPNGVDCDRFQPVAVVPERKRLLFIGSFAHLPNLLAIEYFLHDVWPKLSGYTLHVISGIHDRPTPPELHQPGIELEGFVSDVRGAYTRAEIVIAPLTASAGTNLKVLEAMAMGRVVVSTPTGVHGFELNPGTDVIVTTDMAAEIEALSLDPERRRSIECAARAAALRYDWHSIAREQSLLYHRLDAQET